MVLSPWQSRWQAGRYGAGAAAASSHPDPKVEDRDTTGLGTGF